jgi:hypothetical protein
MVAPPMARERYPVGIADLRISMLDTQPVAFASAHNSDILNTAPRTLCYSELPRETGSLSRKSST